MKASRSSPIRRRAAKKPRTPNLKVKDDLFAKRPKSYDEWRIPGWNERLSTEFTHDRMGVLGFQTLHELRLQALRRKAEKGGRIRVAFFLDCLAIFKTPSLYEAMRESDLFEPFIVLYSSSEKAIGDDRVWNSYLADYEYLRKKGYEVCRGYDDQRRYIDLDVYCPDIVVANTFYHDRAGFFTTQTLLNLKYLTCIFNYGFNIVSGTGYDYHYNNLGVNGAWVYFVETQLDYGEIRRYSRHFGANAVFLGAPFLDAYADTKAFELPHKFHPSRPLVIIAPHWSVQEANEGLERGTFHLYSKFYLDLIDSHPEVNFVFKPHPRLGSQLALVMPNFNYKSYLQEIDSRKNGWVYTGGEYIGLFKKSSLLITDCASFIVEWLPSGSPCLYVMRRPTKKDRYYSYLSRIARIILDVYYLCYSGKDIEDNFQKILIAEKDPNKPIRLKLAHDLLTNIGCSGKKIMAWLKRKIYGTDIPSISNPQT